MTKSQKSIKVLTRLQLGFTQLSLIINLSIDSKIHGALLTVMGMILNVLISISYTLPIIIIIITFIFLIRNRFAES